MDRIYISIDGDDIGRSIEYFILMNDDHGLNEYSQEFTQAMLWLTKELQTTFEGTIIFSGGDSILAQIGQGYIKGVDRIPELFHQRSRNTISVGVGLSLRQAYLSLKLAKVKGKNCIVKFQELQDE